MKPIHFIPLVPTINGIDNGWAFTAFLVALAVMFYFSRQKDSLVRSMASITRMSDTKSGQASRV
jgi:hypothetical protein